MVTGMPRWPLFVIAAIPRASRWAARKMAPGAHPAPRQHPGILRAPRVAALAAIAVLVAAASLVSFAESYRGLYDWAREHGLSGIWAAVWPLQIDTFIAVGELALFVAPPSSTPGSGGPGSPPGRSP